MKMNLFGMLLCSGALSSVTAEMFLEMLRIRETLGADGAVERPLAGVHPHVLLQIARVAELVVAHDARILLVARVRDHVTPERR